MENTPTSNPTPSLDPVVPNPPTHQFSEVEPIGIGGYDLLDTRDRGFAFDYKANGDYNHIVFYRPGTGTIWIVNDEHHAFKPDLSEGDPGKGLAGYPLDHKDDVGLPFNFTGGQYTDHLVFYNTTLGRLSVIKRDSITGQYSAVYSQSDSNGPNAIDLKPGAEVFAFDYDAKGTLDHLAVCYPGLGKIRFYKPSEL